MSVTELVTMIRERLPLYASLTPLQIREFLLHSEIHKLQPRDIVFRRNDYTNSLFSILEGEVGIEIDPSHPDAMVRLGPSEFFGEMGLISGRRRTATTVATQPSLLLEVDRNTMVRLVRTVPEIKAVIDHAAVVRQIKTYLAPGIDHSEADSNLDAHPPAQGPPGISRPPKLLIAASAVDQAAVGEHERVLVDKECCGCEGILRLRSMGLNIT